MQMTIVSNIAKLAAIVGLALLIFAPSSSSFAQGARQSQHHARSTRAPNANAFVRPAPSRQMTSSARSGLSSQDWTAINGAGP